MADIHPFRGIHYNPPIVGDTGRVICPPYDVISPSFQEELYNRSDFNFVRIEYARETPHDTEQDNRYTRAASTLGEWLSRGILTTDARPTIYIDDHHFSRHGKEYCRRNITCVIRLEPWETKIVRPHEATFARAKSDRLNLLYALQANTSPIMALYEDRNGSIPTALSNLSAAAPLFIAETGTGEYHEFHAVSDMKSVSTICGILADQPVYIADGHHRYESALTYQRERRVRVHTDIGSEPFDYVMITLVDFADPGLVILPAHRMVRDVATDRLLTGLADFFHIQSVPVERGNETGQAEKLLAEQSGNPFLVLYGLEPGFFSVLTVSDKSNINSTMPYFHTDVYRSLDVSILDHVILERLLGMSGDMLAAHVLYTNEMTDAIEEINKGTCQFSVLMNPVQPEAIKAIADNGDRMPRKSTYFYPKIPAGLVIYRFG